MSEKQKTAPKKVLALIPWPDEPANDGYAQRTGMIIDALNSLGKLDVVVACEESESIRFAIEKMKQRNLNVTHFPLSTKELSANSSPALGNPLEKSVARALRMDRLFGGLVESSYDRIEQLS
ncbi:MAG: hypothetical protein JXR76_16865 [Deltaproteobacteria bacterium]|nr:hypothetical protein [Deltaproteobacteria bacterium]